MYLKTGMLLLLLALFIQNTCAQSPSKDNRVQLRSINAIGLLNGSAGASVLLQSILGISLHRSFAGIGAGLDYYRFRSIPLFVDLRHEFGRSNRRVFVYADGGYHFDWLTDANKQQAGRFSLLNDFRGGLYYDAGAGVSFRIKPGDAILLSGGYTYKRMKNISGTDVSCPVTGPCYFGMETYRYALSRLVLKAAYQF